MTDNKGIPKLDLSDFTGDDEVKKWNFVQNLGKAYEDIGFVAIRNHQIPVDLIEDLYTEVQTFFNLPLEVKEQYEGENAGQRGYVSFGKEHAKNSDHGDLKEFWHFGQYIEDEGSPLFKTYPRNTQCKELPGFNQTGKNAYKALENTGGIVLRALALYLEENEFFFDDKIRDGNSILRPIHYPPITSEPKDAVRACEHEDINLITLLIGASAEGLEVLNKKKEWIPVTQVKDHIVVNVGDMLQRWTNNKLRSTTHRVANPPKESWEKPRYSIPFFLHPKPGVPLNCLKSCVDQEHPRQYEDISAGDYLNQRLREIGLLA